MAGLWLVVMPGERSERAVPVRDRVHIGRECAGIAASRRILVDDPAVSRDHAEVRLESGSAFLVDHSTNGTRVNGRRVERGDRVALRDGDVVKVGEVAIAVRATLAALEPDNSRRTAMSDSLEHCVVVVGDVVAYTRLIEVHGSAAVAATVDRLFVDLRRIIVSHGGAISGFAGDSILAVWEQSADADAAQSAITCAVALHRCASEGARAAPLRDDDGAPIRFGWAVTAGDVTTGHPSPAGSNIHGDAVNLAFRLAGLAGRGDHAPVLCESSVAELAPDGAQYGAEQSVPVKGRVAPALVRAIHA